jgi:hypothetical protein
LGNFSWVYFKKILKPLYLSPESRVFSNASTVRVILKMVIGLIKIAIFFLGWLLPITATKRCKGDRV